MMESEPRRLISKKLNVGKRDRILYQYAYWTFGGVFAKHELAEYIAAMLGFHQVRRECEQDAKCTRRIRLLGRIPQVDAKPSLGPMVSNLSNLSIRRAAEFLNLNISMGEFGVSDLCNTAALPPPNLTFILLWTFSSPSTQQRICISQQAAE